MNSSFFPRMATLGKLLLSPLLLPFFLVYLLPVHSLILNIVLAALFVVLSLTDLVEAYCARRYGNVVVQGKYLDPLADTLLYCSTLIALLAAHKLFFYWVIILVGRELFVLGLRLVAGERNIKVPVSWFMKLKTIVQLVFVTFVILNPYQACGLSHTWNLVEYTLLLVMLGISVLSAKFYFDQCIVLMGPVYQQREEAGEHVDANVHHHDEQS